MASNTLEIKQRPRANSHLKDSSSQTTIQVVSGVPRLDIKVDVSGDLTQDDDTGEAVFASILSDYVSNNEGNISLEEGDLVRVFPDRQKGDLLYGTINGLSGYFPSSCCKIVSEEEANELLSLPSPQKSWYTKYFKLGDVKGHKRTESTQSSKSTVTITRLDHPAPSTDTHPPASLSANNSAANVVKTAPIRQPGQRLLWVDFMGGAEAVAKLNLSKQDIKRQEVIYEIISTEEDYVRDLEFIIEHYMRPLQKNKLIRDKDLAIIFSNIEQVLPVNQELHHALSAIQAKNPIINIVGDIIIRMSDYLKMYTMYCSNHAFATAKLMAVKQNKPVAKFLDATYKKPESKMLDLSNYLLKPIQRVCKYPLLVRELLRATNEAHPDIENLNKALMKIETVVATINEQRRQTEGVHKMLEIQSKFASKVSFVAPSRTLIKEGLVDCPNSSGDARKRYTVVFNDMMIMAKIDGDKYKMMHMIPYDKISVINDDNITKIEIIYDSKKLADICFDSTKTGADSGESWLKAIQSTVFEFTAQKTRITEARTRNTDNVVSPGTASPGSSAAKSPSSITALAKKMSETSAASEPSESSPASKKLFRVSETQVTSSPSSNVEQMPPPPSKELLPPILVDSNHFAIEEMLAKTVEKHAAPERYISLIRQHHPAPARGNNRSSANLAGNAAPPAAAGPQKVSKPVSKVNILQVQKTGPVEYLYELEVFRQQQKTEQVDYLWKSFNDFFELHLLLLGHFPEEAGIVSNYKDGAPTPMRILPELPCQMMVVSEAVAEARLNQLQTYIDVESF